MKKTLAILALVGSAGCGLLTPRASLRPPLADEGEVLLYLQPWPQGAERIRFTLASMAAVRSDGFAIPLELLLADLPGEGAAQQRLLARGRLPPGTYRSLDVKASSATVMTSDGPAELLVGSEPTSVAAGFEVRAQRATVLLLAVHSEASLQAGYAFAPQFAVRVPPRPLPSLNGVVANSGNHDLTLFDKRRHEVFTALPTGREPKGIALAPGLIRLYVALTGDDQVAVFDLTTGEPLPSIRLTAGDRPRELALSPDGRLLLVLNEASNALAFVDASSGLEITRVPTGTTPTSLLVDRSFRRAYVLNQGSSTMTVVDVATRTVAATVATDPLPVRAQLNRAGNRLYLAQAGSPQMLVFSVPDPASAVTNITLLNRITVGLGASALKIDPRTDLVYLARTDEPRVDVYDAFSFMPIDSFDVPAGVSWFAIDDTENTLLALIPSRRAVAVIDLTSRREVGLVTAGEDPYAVAVAGERF